MTPAQLTKAAKLLKTGGIVGESVKDIGGAVKGIWGSSRRGADTAANFLGKHNAPEAVTGLVRAAPAIGVAGGAYAASQTHPIQRLKEKYQMWKYNRQQNQGY